MWYDELVGIEWAWLAMDGAMTKAPLGGGETAPNPTDRGKPGTKLSLFTDGRGVPLGWKRMELTATTSRWLERHREGEPGRRGMERRHAELAGA
jgi:putative transposase